MVFEVREEEFQAVDLALLVWLDTLQRIVPVWSFGPLPGTQTISLLNSVNYVITGSNL